MNLNAGPIQLTYEGGFLRSFSADGEEVLRMIYFALRNRHWNTARITITDESVRSEADSFAIDYGWQVDDLGIQMLGSAHLEGGPDGSITFDFYGKAIHSFLRNRIGLCVLHPIEGLAGQPCVIHHPGGQSTNAVFPDLISPHQPFLNIQAITWTMVSGQRFRVSFDGDVFETEDQRNWTDASYKTYGTPLEQPFPVEVRAGTEIHQRVVFRPEDRLPTSPVSSPPFPGSVSSQTLMRQQQHPLNTQTVQGSVKTQTLEEKHRETTPIRLGLGHRADGPPLTAPEVDLLKPLGLSHLRADVYLSNHAWPTELSAALSDANQLGIPLELALFFGTDVRGERQQFIHFAQGQNIPLYSILLFQAETLTTTDALLNQVVPVFRANLAGVLLGGGTDGNFVELNRHRFNFDLVDFVTYSINPQVHAFDDQTLLENVVAQADTVRSARVLSGGKPIHISPVTLLPRHNPDAASGRVRDAPPADPRLLTGFGAEWTRRSLQTLLQAGTESVTYYETHGPRGLVNGEEAYLVLDVFRQIR